MITSINIQTPERNDNENESAHYSETIEDDNNILNPRQELNSVEYKYFSIDEEITLKCDCVGSYWNGPAVKSPGNKISQFNITDVYGKQKFYNISIYTKGKEIADTLPYDIHKRLSLIGNNLDLHIQNLSFSDEGIYICDYAVKCNVSQKRYLLQKKIFPTKLRIQNVTNQHTVKGIENCTLSLICLVESGKPSEELRWTKNGNTIHRGGPSKLVYTFVPGKNDHQSVYTCEAQNPDMKIPLTKTIRLDIKYKPCIRINVSGTLMVVEGEMTHICCMPRSNPKPTSINWYNEEVKLVSNYNASSLCFKISNVSRLDSGNYTCSSKNEIGNASSEIVLIISYPPVIAIWYRNLTEYDRNREIRCLAEGEPNIYNYFQWEHKSLFNEHIRYLGATDDGILRLPDVSVSNRYQDTGVYICNVTNGIPDYHGNIFQLGRAYLIFDGPPVFAVDNERIQNYNIGSEIEIKVKVYNSSVITCHNITDVGSMPFIPNDIDVKINPVQMKEKFHDASVTVNGTELFFVLRGESLSGSRKFNVTLCNSHGQSSFVVDSNLLGQSESVENRLYHSVQESGIGVLQTPQDELMDDVTLTVSNSRLYNEHFNRVTMDGQLNYADVVFHPSSSTNEVRIIGLEDRIHYADVDVSMRTAFLTDISSIGDGSDIGSQKSSSEDDFVYVGQIENYMQNRPTHT
ncbi:unnamed protein product [Mytilus coruscus]|uniref:Ig-like domain-containing protein n=1 Tax=Mytilus coruscus TaxID=42192 RepID=A0A6J8ECD0_MYTCO|nr:unnamed protein product [Mytilus coruscus]